MTRKLKRKLAAFTATIALINSGIFYPDTYIITQINRSDDIVTMSDAEGNLFEFEGCEDWSKGDVVSAIMYNSQTEEIYDDVVIKVRYAGTLSMLRKAKKGEQK